MLGAGYHLSTANLGGAHFRQIGPAPDSDGTQAGQKAVTFEEAMLCDSTFRNVNMTAVKILECTIVSMTIDGVLVTDLIATCKNRTK